MAKSLNAYSDCQQYLDSALENSNGIALDLETPGMATRMLQRINTCRKIIRERNKQIYDPHDVNFGTSPYDHLVIKKDPEIDTRVLITTQATKVLKVTQL